MVTQQQAAPSASVIARADSELTDIHRRRSGALELITAAQQELSTLQSARTDRQRAYDEANAQLTQAHSETQRVQAWADLAISSPAEASALAKLKEARSAEKTREKATHGAQKQLEGVQADLNKRAPGLQKSIADNQALIAGLDQRRLSLQVAKDQAFEALGRETLQHVLTQLAVLKGQTDKQREGLIDAKLELDSACEAARATLAPWPTLAGAMEEYNVYEDATTRVLSAWLSFMDVLSTDGPSAKPLLAGNSLAGQIELSAEFLDAVMRRGYEIGKQIADRRAGARNLLELYRENMKP